jgi:hypothetical protein
MIEFEWDDEKNRRNRAKHRLDFSIAAWVFRDPFWQGAEDRTMDYDEVRLRATGMVGDRLITLIYTDRGNRLRIISARKASPSERYEYEKNRS